VRENRLPRGVKALDRYVKVWCNQYRPSTQGSWECPKPILAMVQGKLNDKE